MSVWTAVAPILLPYLTDTATIVSTTAADDGALGQVLTELESDPVPCLLDATGEQSFEVVQSGALKSVRRFQCAFRLGTDIRPQDRLRINGTLYEVVETNQDQTTAAILAVQLQRVQ